MQVPRESDDVRIDAGFVAGDEVSPHYDPMIAKLIVRGSDRREALLKLRASLETYEIAGPGTNIQFIKRLCASDDFVSGLVETGYIEKHRNDLFAPQVVPAEVWAQAGLGVLLQQMRDQSTTMSQSRHSSGLGFGACSQAREFCLTRTYPNVVRDIETANISIKQKEPHTYDVKIGDQSYSNVRSTLMSESTLESFFPHTRITSTVIRFENQVMLFQQGKEYKLQYALPQWMEKALGKKDAANSVVAPMPCKILRVNVLENEEVQRDQPLVVIESMKMETVIRSPQNGVVARVVHRQGVSAENPSIMPRSSPKLTIYRIFAKLARRSSSLQIRMMYSSTKCLRNDEDTPSGCSFRFVLRWAAEEQSLINSLGSVQSCPISLKTSSLRRRILIATLQHTFLVIPGPGTLAF